MPTISPVLPARETDSISPSAKPCRKQGQPSGYQFLNAHALLPYTMTKWNPKPLTLAHLEQVPVHSFEALFRPYPWEHRESLKALSVCNELKQGILFWHSRLRNAGSSFYADTGLCHPPEHPDETLRKNRFPIRRMQRSHCLIFTGIYPFKMRTTPCPKSDVHGRFVLKTVLSS